MNTAFYFSPDTPKPPKKMGGKALLASKRRGGGLKLVVVVGSIHGFVICRIPFWGWLQRETNKNLRILKSTFDISWYVAQFAFSVWSIITK